MTTLPLKFQRCIGVFKSFDANSCNSLLFTLDEPKVILKSCNISKCTLNRFLGGILWITQTLGAVFSPNRKNENWIFGEWKVRSMIYFRKNLGLKILIIDKKEPKRQFFFRESKDVIFFMFFFFNFILYILSVKFKCIILVYFW